MQALTVSRLFCPSRVLMITVAMATDHSTEPRERGGARMRRAVRAVFLNNTKEEATGLVTGCVFSISMNISLFCFYRVFFFFLNVRVVS